MTNNTTAHALAVIDRQVDGCYALILDYTTDLKELAFQDTAEAAQEREAIKLARARMEGRAAGLSYARPLIAALRTQP